MASDSLTNTNISDTYVGVLHTKGDPLPTTGLEYVYDGAGNKSSLKIGRAGVDVSGTFSVDKLVVGEESQDHWYFEDESGVFYLRQKTGSTVNTALTFDTSRKVTLDVQGTADKHLIDKKYVDDQFGASTAQLTENGYQILPSGLIMQWGTTVAGTDNTGTVTAGILVEFPIPFPDRCLNLVTGTINATENNPNYMTHAREITSTNFRMVYDTTDRARGTIQGSWQAYGY